MRSYVLVQENCFASYIPGATVYIPGGIYWEGRPARSLEEFSIWVSMTMTMQMLFVKLESAMCEGPILDTEDARLDGGSGVY